MAAKGASSVLHRPTRKRISASTYIARKAGAKGKTFSKRKVFGGKGMIQG